MLKCFVVMARKYRFFTTYLTTTVSVTLLLLLIGLECVLGLSTSYVFKQIRENVCMSVVVMDEMTETDSLRLASYLDTVAFAHSYEFISKDHALADHIQNLGEDPTLFLDGYNPISASFEVKIASAYSVPDSVEMVASQLSNFAFVEQVQYQKDLVQKLDVNMDRLKWILVSIASILLLVSVALIVNTIRLYVFSKRFIIHTMRLVGATRRTIKAPIVRRTVWQGVLASCLASALLALIVYLTFERLGILLFPITWQTVVMLCAVELLCGLFITFFASSFAVNKYIRMTQDDLYNL